MRMYPICRNTHVPAVRGSPATAGSGDRGLRGRALRLRTHLLDEEIILDGLHAADPACHLGRPAHRLWRIHEAAQLDGALERLHVDLQHFQGWIVENRSFTFAVMVESSTYSPVLSWVRLPAQPPITTIASRIKRDRTIELAVVMVTPPHKTCSLRHHVFRDRRYLGDLLLPCGRRGARCEFTLGQ